MKVDYSIRDVAYESVVAYEIEASAMAAPEADWIEAYER